MRALRSTRRFVAVGAAALGMLVLSASAVQASPMRTVGAQQKISIRVKRAKGTEFILKETMKAALASGQLEWEYLPGAAVSVPFISLQFAGLPIDPKITVLVARTAKLIPDAKKGYSLRIPMLRRENLLLLTVIDPKGAYEDWEVSVSLGLVETAVYVDENCRDYMLKIKELKRPAGPNLVFMGCRMGAGPKEVTLDVLWGDVDRVEYLGRTIQNDSSVISIPLDPKKPTETVLTGFHSGGVQSGYSLSYTPYLPPPYEAWVGLAFFRTAFEQSNFESKYEGLNTAFLGQFWYRPEDIPLSVMLRTFGSLINFSDKLAPAQNYDEMVRTYFIDGELRYRVLDWKGWRIDPLIGGWLFFMDVKSRNFGIQRIINPLLGLVVSRDLFKRDSVTLTLRLAPLQQLFNPFDFRANQMYYEAELTYVHPFAFRNRVFGTVYYGALNYVPGMAAETYGSYLVFGAGYGW